MMPKLSCRRSRRSAPVTQYNSAFFVQTHQKSHPNSSQRLFKGVDPLARCSNVWYRSWYRLFTIWAEVERLKISIFDMCSEAKLVWAADKSIKWPPIPYRMIWVSLLLMELCILLCRRSILSNPPWWACWSKRVDGVWRYVLIPIVSLTSWRHIWLDSPSNPIPRWPKVLLYGGWYPHKAKI